jgi:tetratricopeptide (TPR) repeat protein
MLERPLARTLAGSLALVTMYAAAPARLPAQRAPLDSLRAVTEIAVSRGRLEVLDDVIAALRTSAASPTGARDPWVHYDLGYVLHRRASVMLLSDQVPKAKPLLEESERVLAKAQELGAGPSATGLRGAVTGQLAGASGMFAAIRLGPRAFKLLDEAVAAAPKDPRVALVNGMSRLNAPRAFGGGPAKGEPELRRAVALFAEDRSTSPQPTWGRVDGHIWLAIALEKLGRRDEARTELQKALAIVPGHLWVTKELLPALDKPAEKPSAR